jgi:tetratricopeptide (TPR) repeat protein
VNHFQKIALFFLYLIASTFSFSQDFDMKAELKAFSLRDTFPDNFGFDNKRAMKIYRQMIANTDMEVQKQQYYYELTWQYIYAGYPDSALLCMDRIPLMVWENAYKSNKEYDKLFISGLAHLRKGEQLNCQGNHNEFSCIMPLSEEAQHIKPSGSKMAIEYFKLVLERAPDHYTARWLLNVAYMTLGQYPEQVPDSLLIDFKKFPQDNSLPYFKNIGTRHGVDTYGYYGGTVMEDFNNDGFLDIFVSSGDLRTNCELYLADGKGGFKRNTEEAGLIGITGGSNCTHADYNNDGFTDIYMCRGGWLGPKIGKLHPNSLLRNNGDGTFTDVTKEVGLLGYYASQTASFADFNNDGWLDLFVGNETGYSQLYQNDKGKFKDVSAKSGIYISSLVKGSYWGDLDNDGLIDLYVSVSNGNNYLYKNLGKNENGQFKFINVAQKVGVQKPWGSFPTFIFDFNNDGWLDIFCASYPSDVARMAHQYITDTSNIEYSKLYINQGDGSFKDIAVEANLGRSIEAMGLNFGDVDNDGWLDFYVGTGFPSFEALIPNLLFRNNQGEDFLEVQNAGFGHLQKGHGIGFGDLDNDGDQDVYISMGGFMESDAFWNVLLENPGNDNNWITLDLVGVVSNRSAIGATIKIVAQSEEKDVRTIFRQVSPGGSFGSSSLQQEIGLGKCTNILSITITWPSSQDVQVFKEVEINKAYTLTEGKSKLKEKKTKKVKMSDSQNQEHQHQHH